MNFRYSLQAQLCMVLTSTLVLSGCIHAQAAQSAQELQMQQALAQYVATQGKDPVAAARVQALLMTVMASEGQAASPQQVQAAMAAIAVQKAQTSPEAVQSALLASLARRGQGTGDTTAASRFAGIAAGLSEPLPNGPQASANGQSVSVGSGSAQAKKPGVFRIGVMPPAAQVASGQASLSNLSESLRNLIVQDLSGPLVEVVQITSMIPVQVEAEVKQKGCDYLLYSSFQQKQKNGAGGFLKKAGALAPMMSMIPMAGGMTGMMAGAAAGSAMGAAGSMSSLTKAKDQWTLTYKLMLPGNDTPVLSNSSQATAKSDGEDVVKSLIDQEAISVLNQLTQKK